MYTSNFLPIFTSLFFGLYTYSIGYEFDKIHRNIYNIQHECRELRTEISNLKTKANIYE